MSAPRIPWSRARKIVTRHLVDYPPPTPQPTPCRLWQGAEVGNGYGQKWDKVRRRLTPVHRWVWEEATGPIPEGMNVLHRCDNPPCYRFAHLFLGTQLDNIADRHGKGRSKGPRGEAHGRSKLTHIQVTDIRRRLAEGVSTAQLAQEHGVHVTTIQRIKSGERWA